MEKHIFIYMKENIQLSKGSRKIFHLNQLHWHDIIYHANYVSYIRPSRTILHKYVGSFNNIVGMPVSFLIEAFRDFESSIEIHTQLYINIMQLVCVLIFNLVL